MTVFYLNDKLLINTCANNAGICNKLATIFAPHRDSFSAKVSGLVAGWLRQVILTAHTRGPLAATLH